MYKQTLNKHISTGICIGFIENVNKFQIGFQLQIWFMLLLLFPYYR